MWLVRGIGVMEILGTTGPTGCRLWTVLTYFAQHVGPGTVEVIRTAPGFTVERYREQLRGLHERIQTDGVFVARSTRVLVEAHKP